MPYAACRIHFSFFVSGRGSSTRAPSSFQPPTYKEPFSLGPPSSPGQVRMQRNDLSASSEAVPISRVTSNISFSRVSLPFNIKSSSGTGVCGTQRSFPEGLLWSLESPWLFPKSRGILPHS